MKVLRTQAGEDALITVSGEPSLRDASALRAVLIESLQSAAGTDIDMSMLERADLAFLQVICAAARTFEDARIRLSVGESGDDSGNAGVFRTALRAAGFADMPLSR